MKNSRIFLTSACFFCAATGFEAGAQTCHTVRDKDGLIVYQSIRPPVDTSVPYKYEIEALFPGGYMQIDNFFRCGSYERPAPVVPSTTNAPIKKKELLRDVPAVSPTPLEPQEPKQFNKENATDATLVVQAQPATQSPSNNSFGLIMPKILAAGLIVGILCLPKRARNLTFLVVAGIVILAIGFAVYESARPPTLPFAQCVIDNVPSVQNDVAAYAAASQCVEFHGGYNSVAAKRYLKGQAVGFMTPKSRAECVTKHASNTQSEMAAKLVYGASSCLYQSASE